MNNKTMSREARDFIKLVKTGQLPKEILPNSAPNYTLFQEKVDTDYYIRVFLQSAAYDLIKECEEVTYDGE